MLQCCSFLAAYIALRSGFQLQNNSLKWGLNQKLEMVLCCLSPRIQIFLVHVTHLGRISTKLFSQVPHEFCFTWMKTQSSLFLSTTSWATWKMPSITECVVVHVGTSFNGGITLAPCLVGPFPCPRSLTLQQSASDSFTLGSTQLHMSPV